MLFKVEVFSYCLRYELLSKVEMCLSKDSQKVIETKSIVFTRTVSLFGYNL